MLNWLLRFLLCALCIIVVVYVCKLLLSMVFLPEPMGTIVLLIIGLAVVIFIVRYLGWPPPPSQGP